MSEGPTLAVTSTPMQSKVLRGRDVPHSNFSETKNNRGLTHSAVLVALRLMKEKFFLLLVGAGFIAAGCVPTVTGRNTGGVPFIKDRVEGHYERPVDQVYDAAKEVVKFNGTLLSESILHNQSNTVKTVEGKVNQRSVWVRVEAMDPKVTGVVVQTRTTGGVSDIDLAHEIEKQIALKLVR
jgi:hypothetical protein